MVSVAAVLVSETEDYFEKTAASQGGRGVYVRAQRSLLPPRASDMLLAVRIRAIDGKGLSPSRFAALPAATRTFATVSPSDC
jgi:hypothetical protein